MARPRPIMARRPSRKSNRASLPLAPRARPPATGRSARRWRALPRACVPRSSTRRRRRGSSSGGEGWEPSGASTIKEIRRYVARKEMDPALALDPVARDRFLMEAQVTGQLEHPHIVPVYELHVGEGNDAIHFAMKLVEGETLARLIHAKPVVAERGDTEALGALERLPEGLRRGRLRAQSRRRAPRSQARERDDRLLRAGLRDGLGHCPDRSGRDPAGRSPENTLRASGRAPRQDGRTGEPRGHGHDPRHSPLHGARASLGARGRNRLPDGRLRPGRDSLPHAHREPAVRRPARERRAGGGARGRDPAAGRGLRARQSPPRSARSSRKRRSARARTGTRASST